MSTFYTQGIILKKTDWGEADGLFSIYTLDKGQVIALGRATKKIKSKLNGFLQPFAVLNLMIAHGKYYDHIAGVTIKHRYVSISGDLKKIILANYGLEIIDRLTKPDGPDENIYNLLNKYLTALDENNFISSDWQLVKQAFVVKLLSLLGFTPPSDIADNQVKLDKFLNSHLDFELNTVQFINRLGS